MSTATVAKIERGDDPLAADPESGNTPLIWAGYWTEDPEVLDLLLARGADGIPIKSIVANFRSAAGARGRPEPEVPEGARPAHRGGVGIPETVRTLLAAGGDPNIADGRGRTALHWAAAEDDTTESVRRLMAHGADATRRGQPDDTGSRAREPTDPQHEGGATWPSGVSATGPAGQRPRSLTASRLRGRTGSASA